MTRTISDVDGLVSPVRGTDCDDENMEDCIIGVVLDGWVGSALATDDDKVKPISVWSDYTIDVQFKFLDGTQDFRYPQVTVNDTAATWDPGSEGFGSGTAIVGKDSSSINFPGSTTEGDTLLREYIPDELTLDEGYGCYQYNITVTLDSGWAEDGPTVISNTIFYKYEHNSGENEEMESETLFEDPQCAP
jgi:hypothetical protein